MKNFEEESRRGGIHTHVHARPRRVDVCEEEQSEEKGEREREDEEGAYVRTYVRSVRAGCNTRQNWPSDAQATRRVVLLASD